MDIVPLMTTFAFIFLAELGDKTQLTVVMLSSRTSAISVFGGSMLAFFLVDGASALIGGELLGFLPYKLVSFGSGLVFISSELSRFFVETKKSKLRNKN